MNFGMISPWLETLDSLVIDRPCPASSHERVMVMAATDWANTTKTTSQNGDNDSLYIHALKMLFRNYYVAYAFVGPIVCV